MVRTREPRILTREEIPALAEALPEALGTIFLTGALLGLRIGEILALKAGHVDRLNRQISGRRDVYREKVGPPKTAARACCRFLAC